VLAATRCDTQASAEEALDLVLPVVELAAQLDDLSDGDAVVSGLPEQGRHRVAPRVLGRSVADGLRAEWGLGIGPVLIVVSVIEAHSECDGHDRAVERRGGRVGGSMTRRRVTR
jgi:hypothetical protein